ncbi:MAG: metallophosphoesterase [bacterium]
MTPSETLHVLADVHANFEALNVVLDDLPDDDESQIICLGDIVGYGPDPDRCLEALTDRDALLLAGNHDAAACGEMSTKYFNRLASQAAKWTQDQLSENQLATLAGLPERQRKNGLGFYHGSPRQPLTEYITSEPLAADILDDVEESKVFVGHTHKPVYFEKDRATTRAHSIKGDKELDRVNPDTPMILNPGSVGQPRDGDPRASYMTVTFNNDYTLNFRWKRLKYPIEPVQSKIREAGLPETLATRLSRGQ